MGKNNRIVLVGGNKSSVALDTDPLLAGDTDDAVATQKAIKAYTDASQAAGVAALINNITPTAMTASGALPTGSFVTLSSTTPAIAATLAAPAAGRLLVVTQIDAGTIGHTLRLAAGTFDGTNNTATFNAANETLVLFGLTATRFAIILDLGSVGMSST